MAGLGKACSHVAALLFAVETNTQLKNQICLYITLIPCSWLPPSFQSVQLAEITHIDFSTVLKQKRLLINDEANTSASSVGLPPAKKKVLVVSNPCEEEKDSFYIEHSLLMQRKACYFVIDT